MILPVFLHRFCQPVKTFNMIMQSSHGSFRLYTGSVHLIIIFLIINSDQIVSIFLDQLQSFVCYIFIIRKDIIVYISSAENDRHTGTFYSHNSCFFALSWQCIKQTVCSDHMFFIFHDPVDLGQDPCIHCSKAYRRHRGHHCLNRNPKLYVFKHWHKIFCIFLKQPHTNSIRIINHYTVCPFRYLLPNHFLNHLGRFLSHFRGLYVHSIGNGCGKLSH